MEPGFSFTACLVSLHWIFTLRLHCTLSHFSPATAFHCTHVIPLSFGVSFWVGFLSRFSFWSYMLWVLLHSRSGLPFLPITCSSAIYNSAFRLLHILTPAWFSYGSFSLPLLYCANACRILAVSLYIPPAIPYISFLVFCYSSFSPVSPRRILYFSLFSALFSAPGRLL